MKLSRGTCFSLSKYGSFVGQPILAAAGFQPACEPPERRLQARLPAPLRAVNGQSLQAGLPAARKAKPKGRTQARRRLTPNTR